MIVLLLTKSICPEDVETKNEILVRQSDCLGTDESICPDEVEKKDERLVKQSDCLVIDNVNLFI